MQLLDCCVVLMPCPSGTMPALRRTCQSDSLVHREEAGTPNVIVDIRAAMVYMVKQAVGVDESSADNLLDALMAGNEIDKPGWVRLNLSALMSDDKVEEIIQAVDSLTRQIDTYQSHYTLDERTARAVLLWADRHSHHRGAAG